MVATSKYVFFVELDMNRIRMWSDGAEGFSEIESYRSDTKNEKWSQVKRLGDEVFVVGKNDEKPFAIQLSGGVPQKVLLDEFGPGCKGVLALSGQEPAFLLYNCPNSRQHSGSSPDECKEVNRRIAVGGITEYETEEDEVDLCKPARLVLRSENRWHVESIPSTPPIIVRSENFRRRVEKIVPKEQQMEKESEYKPVNELDSGHWSMTEARDGALLGATLFLSLSTDRIMFIDTRIAGAKWGAFELPSWDRGPENDHENCTKCRLSYVPLGIEWGRDGVSFQSTFLEAGGKNKLTVIWGADCQLTSAVTICEESRCKISTYGAAVDSVWAREGHYSFGAGILAFSESPSTTKWFVDGMGRYLSVLDEKSEGSISFPSLVLAALKGTKWKQIADLDGKRFVATLENGEIYLLEPFWFTTKLQRIGKL